MVRQDQVVGFLAQTQEAETAGEARGKDGDTYICSTGGDAVGYRKVAGGGRPIPLYAVRVHSRQSERVVEQCAAPRSLFAVEQAKLSVRQIADPADAVSHLRP